MQHKFRAWDKKTKTMLSSCDDYTVWVGGKGASINGKFYGKERNFLSISYDDVMQFTNFYAGGIETPENEIYDGAILSVPNIKRILRGDESRICVVFWDKHLGTWCIKFSDYLKDYLCDYSKEAKILGSIQENPELLGAKA